MVNRASGIRLVAAMEAMKGLLVIAAGFGLLSLIHKDLEAVAETLVLRLHLNPDGHFPHVFLHLVNRFADVRLWLLALLAFAYAAMRLIEAYGLWHHARWAEWFAVASGGIYIPLELYELSKGFNGFKLAALLLNIAIVAYMAYMLWDARRERAAARSR
jgi:uncharacterized membrane protein (DUF2068 family)